MYQLNVAELSENIETIKARFAGSRLLWVKELATYLNNHLLVETDPTFAGKPRDYPASLLNPDLRSVITSTLQSCEDEVLDLFYDQSLITIPAEMNRGLLFFIIFPLELYFICNIFQRCSCMWHKDYYAIVVLP